MKNLHLRLEYPLNTTFLYQSNNKFSVEFENLILSNNKISIATAYLTSDALLKFNECFLTKEVRILCGIHGNISDLWALQKYIKRNDLNIKGNVFIGFNTFHSKLYIFNSDNHSTILIGSPNFTNAGLNNNEEICLKIEGLMSENPFNSINEYFEELWTNQSVSVADYLSKNPEYKVKVANHENINEENKQILKTLKESKLFKYSLSFKNKVIKTVYNYGRQTIPTHYNNIIDSYKLMAVGQSMPFDILLPDGTKVDGKIRYGLSSWGNYYELGIRKYDVYKLRNIISENNELEYQIDLNNKLIKILIV